MTISKGNTKLGNIPNISLTPIKSCYNCSSCRKDCYALKSYRMYKTVKKSWDDNFKLYKKDSVKYFKNIDSYLTKHRPRLFRWHVAGDIQNQSYADNMIQIAKNHPKTNFLAFTKMFKLNYSKCPGNLSIIFSMWPGQRKPKHKKGVAGFYWMQDGTEKRVPKETIECFGTCDNCGVCFNLKNTKINHIVNAKH